MGNTVFKFGVADAAFSSTDLADIGDHIELNGLARYVAFCITNDGVALKDFALLVNPKYNEDFTVYLAGNDWDKERGVLRKSVGKPQALASGKTAYAYVDIGPIYAMKFQAKVASGLTNIDVSGHAR